MTTRRIDLPFVSLILFSACLIWLSFLTQGLPIGDPDDWDHVLAATDLPWKTFFENLVTPWSKSEIWSGQINRMNEVLNQRLFRSIVLKAVQSLFNFHSFPYYFFSKVIFFSGTVVLLFSLIVKFTRSQRTAFAASLFFTLIPAHYTHLLWLSDPDTIAHFWVLLSLFFFLRFIDSLEANKQKSIRALLFFFAAGWLAMKTKESALVLPLSVGAFSFFQSIMSRRYKKEFLLCFLLCLFLAFLIVPIAGFSAANRPSFSFNYDTLMRLIFKNDASSYGAELTSAFFSLEQIWPASIVRSFGFFLLWALVISGCFYFVKTKFKLGTFPLQIKALLWISFLWILAWAVFVSSFQPDPRYFSGAMIPVTLLGAYFMHRVIELWSGAIKIGLIGLMVAALCLNLFENVQHVIFLRQQIGQRTNRFIILAKTIFEDRYGPQSISEVGRFYSAEYIRDPERQPRIKDMTYHVEMGYGLWSRSEQPSLDEFESFAKKGFLYCVTLNKDLSKSNDHIRLIKTISGINENSLVERLTYQLKRKTPQPLYVLKWIS